MKFVKSLVLGAVLTCGLFGATSLAQDGEPIVIDEVVAQVNDSVITLSRVKREMKNAVDQLVQRGKTPEEARREVDASQSELIANLINEEMLVQKGKETGAGEDAEAEVNQRFESIRREQGIRTIAELEDQMRKSGLDPTEIRNGLRKQFIRQAVLQSEVNRRLYFSFSKDELLKYYEANKTKFKKPETVSLSEIFLSYAGRDKASVDAKAAELVAQLRGGADFTAFVKANSERPNASQTNGKIDTFVVSELNEDIAKVTKNVKAGSYAEPFVTEEGVILLRVDERTAGSDTPEFNENAARQMLLAERAPNEQKKYMTDLRKDSYIKISPNYRDSVAAILYREDKPTGGAALTTNKNDK